MNPPRELPPLEFHVLAHIHRPAAQLGIGQVTGEAIHESAEAAAVHRAGTEIDLRVVRNRLGRLVRAAAYYPSPGIASEFITSFVGEADLGAAGGLHGLAEEDEDIRALVVPLEDALDAAESGEIANAPLLVTLHWLARHRDRLVAAWTDTTVTADAG